MTRISIETARVAREGDPGRYPAVDRTLQRVRRPIAAIAARTVAGRRGRGPRGRARRSVLRALAAAAMVLPLFLVNPPSASAIGDTPIRTANPTLAFTHQATTDSNPFDLTNGALTFNMAQGEKVWLYTTGLSASTTTTATAPGVTFIIQCYGPGIASTGTGWYIGRNLDAPNHGTFAGQVRTAFMPPSSGTYTCKMRAAAYQPISGTSIPVSFKGGAYLNATPIKPTSSLGVTAGYGWAAPNSSTQPYINSATRTLRHNSGTYTFESPSSPVVTMIMDQMVTTCAPGDKFTGCAGATSGGTTVKSTLLAQPENTDGTPCGTSTPIPAVTQTVTVTTAYHHYPLQHTAVLNKASDLHGCPRVTMTLELTWVSGQALVVHTLRPNDERPSWGGIYEHS